MESQVSIIVGLEVGGRTLPNGSCTRSDKGCQWGNPGVIEMKCIPSTMATGQCIRYMSI